MTRIFLCHAKEDIKSVRNLYEKLKQAGFNPWLDEKNILAGQNPDYEIRQTITEQIDFILICLSMISVQKRGYVNKEIKWALDRQDEMLPGDIFTIPVKLEACDLPFHLRERFPVDLSAPDGFEKLLKSLRHQSGKMQGPEGENACEISGSNPFHVGGAVPVPLFFGRKNILRTIRNRIAGQVLQSVSIVGERRMGKSSLLNYVKNEFIKDLPQKYLIIYMDLMIGYCHSRKGLMRALRREISKSWQQPWPESEDGNLSVFDFVLEDLQAENIRLVLCLDEMENLTRRPAEFDDLLEDWRANAQMGRMAIITASNMPLADLCKKYNIISPFDNIFIQQYLGLSEYEEWKNFIRNHISVSTDDISFIEQTAGGHPFFTQMTAYYLWE